MFADESDEVCRLCYHLSSTFTEGVGRITASDQTVRAVHSCISWLFCGNRNITVDVHAELSVCGSYMPLSTIYIRRRSFTKKGFKIYIK